MTDCARCGDCCERVAPQTSVPDLRRKLADPYYAGWNRNQAERIVQMLTERVDPDPNWDRKRPSYRCKHFNPETRECEAHEARPWMCAGYPWYRDGDLLATYPLITRLSPKRKPSVEPELGSRIPLDFSPRCSFTADVRKMLPLVAV